MSAWATKLATCFGIGWIKPAPGTVASAAALLPGALIVALGWPIILAAAIVVTPLGIWACGDHARRMGIYDPSECVLDEVAGQWFALVPLGMGELNRPWLAYGASFLLFRLLDITKPWPIAALERLPGGYGVMMDDVAAGLVSALILYGLLSLGVV